MDNLGDAHKYFEDKFAGLQGKKIKTPNLKPGIHNDPSKVVPDDLVKKNFEHLIEDRAKNPNFIPGVSKNINVTPPKEQPFPLPQKPAGPPPASKPPLQIQPQAAKPQSAPKQPVALAQPQPQIQQPAARQSDIQQKHKETRDGLAAQFIFKNSDIFKNINIQNPKTTSDFIIKNIQVFINKPHDGIIISTIALCINYLNENPQMKNDPMLKSIGIDLSKILNADNLMELVPSNDQRIALLSKLIQLCISSQPKAQPQALSTPKPQPQPIVKQVQQEYTLPQMRGERKIQNPILREAAKPSSPNEKVVTTHTEPRRICKHEGNTCFVNTALQLCAHFKQYDKLFNTPLVQRNGELNAAFQNRKNVQQLGRQMIDQLRNPQEGQPVTGAFKFLQALEACGVMDKNESAELFKARGGDPTNVIRWMTTILDPEGKKSPPPVPIPPYSPQAANTALIMQHAPAGPAQDKALAQRNAVKENYANKECCFIEYGANNPQPIQSEILVPEVKDGKTVWVVYQLEVVMSGGTGHTYPGIRSGENFIIYNDWPADPPKPEVIHQSQINTIPSIRRCYYAKKNPQ